MFILDYLKICSKHLFYTLLNTLGNIKAFFLLHSSCNSNCKQFLHPWIFPISINGCCVFPVFLVICLTTIAPMHPEDYLKKRQIIHENNLSAE